MHLNQICVCVCVHAHTYATDITVFEENSSIKLSREKFNFWKAKAILKESEEKIWFLWKIFQINNFEKFVRSALLQPFISAALVQAFLLRFPSQQSNTNQCLTCHFQ